MSEIPLRAAARRSVLILVAAVLAVVSGCTGAVLPDDRNTSTAELSSATATVTEEGFSVSVGPITAQAAAGVAPVGTRVTLESVAAPSEVRESGTELAAPVFDIAFAEGIQPKTSVTVSLRLSKPPAPDAPLAFVTKNSETQEWTGLPVTTQGSTVTVEMDHFSMGFFGWFDNLADEVAEEMLRFMQLRYDEPACVGAEPEIDGRRFTVKTDNTAIYACVEEIDAVPQLTVHSNSPYVWTVRTDIATAQGQKGRAPLGASQVVTLATFNLLQGYDFDAETVLVPGGVAPVTLRPDAVGTTAVARVDAGLGLIAVAAAGVGMLTAVGVEVPYESLISVGECVADAIGAAMDTDVALVLRTVFGCAATVVSGAAAVVVGALLSLAPLLATQITGLVGEFTGDNTAVITVSSVQVGPPKYPVPAYCDQPQRTAPLGESSDAAGRHTWLEGPLAWPGTEAKILHFSCTAGGVSWPGAVLVYNDRRELAGVFFLEEAQPTAYRGSFQLESASFDGDQVTVPYNWQASGAEPSKEGAVTLRWDAAGGKAVLDGVSHAGVTLELPAGGRWLFIDGQPSPTDDTAEVWLVERLGPPEEVQEVRDCLDEGISARELTWGDLKVTILTEPIPQEVHPYGFAYPPGGVSGWRFDSLRDGAPEPSHTVTAESVPIPTDLAALRSAFASGWDYADVFTDEHTGERYFQAFAGDVTGIAFPLNDDGTIDGAIAGLTCRE